MTWMDEDTGRNVRFACLQIYCKSCYKFQICNDLPHLHACKFLICTHGKVGGKCGNGREAVRRKSVANPLQTNYFATSLHACKFNANIKFASDLHIRISVDYIKLANGLQTCKLVANMKFAIGLHHVLYVRKCGKTISLHQICTLGNVWTTLIIPNRLYSMQISRKHEVCNRFSLSGN